MKTILVDDMLLDMRLFELKVRDVPDFEIVGKFKNPMEAIEYAKNNVVDFAMLDIDMPGMNGIELAKQLRQIRSDIIIVFATAHPKFAVEAMRMKADYIIFKPFDRDDIVDVIRRAKLFQQWQRKRYYFRTFGLFDMLVDGKSVRFHSAKAKELMALCVWRNGSPVTIYEIVERLWGEELADTPERTGYRRAIKELADTLKSYDAESLFIRERGSIRIDMSQCESDYQSFWNGEMDAVCQFQGSFMEQYSWAEAAVYSLEERKQVILSRNN